MALFGKSDDWVPLLTAFYQATPDIANPIGSEIDILMSRFSYNEPHTLELWSDRRKGQAEMVGPGETIQRDHVEGCLRRLTYVQPLFVRMMNAAADEVAPSVEDEFAFNHLIEEELSVPSVRFVHDVGRAYPIVWYTNDPTIRITFNSEQQVSRFLSAALSHFIQAVQKEAFQRCAQCNSVYVATRKGRKYCSLRCSNRFNARRTYERAIVGRQETDERGGIAGK